MLKFYCYKIANKSCMVHTFSHWVKNKLDINAFKTVHKVFDHKFVFEIIIEPIAFSFCWCGNKWRAKKHKYISLLEIRLFISLRRDRDVFGVAVFVVIVIVLFWSGTNVARCIEHPAKMFNLPESHSFELWL